VSEAPARESEADDATRGSAVKLAAEIASRALLAAVPFLLLRGLGAAEFGRFTQHALYALLLAELGELGLANLASRALVAGTHSLRALVRARLALLALVGLVALGGLTVAPALVARLGGPPVDGLVLASLVAWMALSGWAEFLGVALRCRRARRQEALVLLVLRGCGLALAVVALALGGGLRLVALALAASPLPALATGTALLQRRTEPHPSAERPPLSVLRDALPLGAHGALLLLSPRVEFLVLSWRAPALDSGLFAAGLQVVWPLALVPTAVVAGAMPALTREALGGGAAVRRRTAVTLGALAAAAGVGLALVAPALVRLLLGPGSPAADHAAATAPLRILAASLPAAFLNALVAGALIASGRARWLPWLTAGRVLVAFALALALVPRFGASGAAAGLVLAEWALLAAGRAACGRAGFAVPALSAVAWGLCASVPMALAVSGVRDSLLPALPVGALTWAATLAAARRLAPSAVRRLTGELRYP
jgi:O-antigen/teichoic acid export membrane protein